MSDTVAPVPVAPVPVAPVPVAVGSVPVVPAALAAAGAPAVSELPGLMVSDLKATTAKVTGMEQGVVGELTAVKSYVHAHAFVGALVGGFAAVAVTIGLMLLMH